MKTSTGLITLAAVALCLFGTACSSSSGTAAGTSSSSAVVAVTGSAAAPAVGSAAAVGIAPAGGGTATCKQLTFAEVQPLIVETIYAVDVTAINADGTGQQCVFNAKNADSSGAITVQVLSGAAGTQAYAEAVSEETKPVPVTGVGDKASRDTEEGGVDALKGDLYCSVTYSSSDGIPGVGPLEEAHGATNNIGENYYDTIAQAMGTLCNRVYGSGNTTPDLSSLLAADKTATTSDDGGLPSMPVLPTDASSGAAPTS